MRFSYQIILFVTSTLLLLMGQLSDSLSHPILALSSVACFIIAFVFACRSSLSEPLTALAFILIAFLGPIAFVLIYSCFSSKQFHTGNILIVVIFLLLRRLLRKPITKLGLKTK